MDTNGTGVCNESTTYPDVHSQQTDRDNVVIQSHTPGMSSTISGTNTGTIANVHLNHSGGALNSANSHSTKCTSDDESSTSITSGSGQVASGGNQSYHNSGHLSSSPLKMKPLLRPSINSKQSDSNFEMIATAEIEQFKRKLEICQEECVRITTDLNCLKGQYQNDVSLLNQALQDEKERVDVSVLLRTNWVFFLPEFTFSILILCLFV